MSKESRRRSVARKWLREKLGVGVLESIAREKQIKEKYVNYGVAEHKFVPGIVRLTVENGLEDVDIEKLDKYVALIGESHADEYDNDLNGMSFVEIDERFASKKDYHLEEDKIRSRAKERKRNESYKIVPIDTSKDALEYSKYTTWCVTRDGGAYDSYTSNGIGRFYFCLKDGYENVQEKAGENTPLDEYGLSMIAISVGIDGSAHTITCRWNHANGGGDSVMTVEEVENLLGMSFYDAFPPFTREELHARGKYMLDEVNDEVNVNGKTPNELGCSVFGSDEERYRTIKMYDRSNVYDSKENKVMFKNWFARIELTDRNVMIGEQYGDTNLYAIGGDGKPLLERGKYKLRDYSEGFVVVEHPKNGKMHYLNVDTLELIKANGCPEDEWFMECQPMKEGFGIVTGWDDAGNEVWNLLYTDGHWANE